MYFFRATLYLSCIILLSGCSGFQNLLTRDPFSGGKNISQSPLLNIKLPPGFHYYPQFSEEIIPGMEGVETWRGYLEEGSASHLVYDSLKTEGWRLILAIRTEDKSLYIYQKDSAYIIFSFRKQGVLTIMEIWKGNRLPENTILEWRNENSTPPDKGFAGEVFGPEDSWQDTEVIFDAPLLEKEL